MLSFFGRTTVDKTAAQIVTALAVPMTEGYRSSMDGLERAQRR